MQYSTLFMLASNTCRRRLAQCPKAPSGPLQICNACAIVASESLVYNAIMAAPKAHGGSTAAYPSRHSRYDNAVIEPESGGWTA